MNRSILWNGFEIRKGVVKSDAGEVPYLMYSPAMSNEIVNIAIHGENSSKDEWLCFNSISQYGNLLKESIRNNSIFIALDLYGHGEWNSEDRSFNSREMSQSDEELFYKKSIEGLSIAINEILTMEGLNENPISITSVSKGCNIALNLDINRKVEKQILLSPVIKKGTEGRENLLILKGKRDKYIDKESFKHFIESLKGKEEVELFNSDHQLPSSWINKAKAFIYQSQI